MATKLLVFVCLLILAITRDSLALEISTPGNNIGIGTTVADTAYLTVGSRAISSGAIATHINLGSDFSTTPGGNLKLKIYDASSADYGFGVSSAAMDYVVNASSDSHVFYAGTAPILIMKGTGNVGIGTTTPANKLSVGGTVGIGTNVNSPYISTTPSGAGLIVQGNTGLGTLAPRDLLEVGTGKLSVESGGNVGVGTINPTSELQVNGTVTAGQLNLSGTSNITFTPNSESISNTIDGLLDVSGGMTFTGNVGVGTVSPRFGLEVVGNVGIGTSTVQTPAALYVNGNIVLPAGSNIGLGTLTPANVIDIRESDDPTKLAVRILTSTTGGAMAVYNGGSVKVNLAGSGVSYFTGGSLGVGDTTPDYAFETTPSFAVSATANGDGDVLIANPSGNGNIGIGSTAPGTKLDIQAGTSGFRVFGTVSKWSVKSGANTACDTTCGTSQCAFGQDSGTSNIAVACSDATADVCVCMGP